MYMRYTIKYRVIMVWFNNMNKIETNFTTPIIFESL